MHINEVSEEEQIALIRQNWGLMQSIENPSERVQLAAVEHNPMVMQYIKNPSEKVQLAAVGHDPRIIMYIRNPSEKVQLAAVEKDGRAIRYIRNQTEELQLAAIEETAFAVQYLRNPSERVQLAAIELFGWEALELGIKNPSERAREAATRSQAKDRADEVARWRAQADESFDPRSIARLLSEDIRENNGFLLEAWDSRRPNDYITTQHVEELMGHGARKASEMVLDRVYEQTFHRSWPNFKASYIEIARKHGEQSLPESERKMYVTMRDAQREIEELLKRGEFQQAIDYAIKTVSDLAAS